MNYILKPISTFLICILFTSCFNDNVKEIDDQNFSYIEITDYPLNKENTKNARLILYKKGSNFKEKISEYDDFSFEVTPSKVLNIKFDFDNSQPINEDMEFIVNENFYYQFKDIAIRYDTFKKPNIIGNDLYLYKNMKATVNEKPMEFKEYKIHENKTIQLPFALAKKL
ncbi:hypothetical protein VUJ46_01685 [Chryseobacterium sp. MYb264]|uniref:hypothetical protein n=1 Tax=Chryseobacterium sp. MYb264 TaxID=2745153 RepID=UPI002E15BC42|nr:hypothetical protein VUJ46_01685 [Chryseobacterium sp. MYb264]